MPVNVTGGDKALKALQDIASKLKGRSVRIGFLEGATYPNGTPVALVAAIQNFGAPSRNIPPRPFFSNMINEHASEWPAALEAVLKANNYDLERSLAQMGEAIAGQLRQAITDFEGVPLSDLTIRRKGFDKQLVDTGHMLNSVEYEIAGTNGGPAARYSDPSGGGTYGRSS